jgi:hypothetical protein
MLESHVSHVVRTVMRDFTDCVGCVTSPTVPHHVMQEQVSGIFGGLEKS